MAGNANPGNNVWTSYTGPNKYGAPPKNSNRAELGRDNAILTQDYTGRALTNPDPTQDITSPLALSGATTAQVLVIPPNATQVTLIGSAAFSFSEYGSAGSALTQSVSVPANTPVTFDTARMKNIYVAGTGNLSFWFQTL